MTVYYVWPFRILPPVQIRPYRVGNAKLGPMAMDGAQQQTTRSDGGGLWRFDCLFRVFSIDQVKALRAWSSYLDGGMQDFIMPMIDARFAPRRVIAGALEKPVGLNAASDYFAEVAEYSAPLVIAEIVEAADLRATSIKVAITQGSAPKGGEHLSINHPTKGWRLYRAGRITAIESGDIYTMDIRPPLREAITIGSGNPSVEYDIPRCLMRLHPESLASIELAILNFRVGAEVSISFLESFDSTIL